MVVDQGVAHIHLALKEIENRLKDLVYWCLVYISQSRIDKSYKKY